MSPRRPFTHFVITRYSVRLDGHSVLRDKGKDWLFDSGRLALRRVLFQHVTLASIAASTVRPDRFLIVIDRDLPADEQMAMADLVDGLDWVDLVVWNPEWDFKTIDWILEQYQVHSPYIVTSQMDDDDAVQSHYLSRIIARIQEDLSSLVPPVWRWYGGNHALEWDLGVPDAPLGALKPWSGGTQYWQGVGTSLLVPAQKGEPTVYAWTHDKIEKVFAPIRLRQSTFDPMSFRLRASLAFRLLKRLRLRALCGWTANGWLRQMGGGDSSTYDMLISNNGSNLQDIRRGLGVRRRSDEDILARLTEFGIQEAGVSAITEHFDKGDASPQNPS